LAILGVLERDRSHPSAEEIHRALAGDHPSLSLSTVYLTLQAFVRAGLTRKISEVDGRMRVDGTLHDHDHAICRGCGRIYDVDRDRLSPKRPKSRLPGGLEVLGVRVEYDVVCASCRTEG
jgi:Fur family peroxide stress response transcriptional regulator